MNKNAVLAGSLLTLFVSGCSYAKKSDLDAVKADLAATKRTADQALTRANEASQTATDAQMKAAQANEAVTRGFKKSMRK